MTTTTLTAALAAVDHYQYVEARTPRDLDPVLTPTLGVEVTQPEVAARCGLGNIDPQHGHHREGAVVGGDGRGGAHCTAAPMAAVEAATWARVASLPRGARLITTRADLDSVCAMAVVVARAEEARTPGTIPGCHTCLPWEGCPERAPWDDRIRLVAEADAFASGPWPGPVDLPVPLQPWGGARASVDSRRELAALHVAVQDRDVPLAERVRWALRWLLTGEEPEGYRARAEAARVALAEAVAVAIAAGRDCDRDVCRRRDWGPRQLDSAAWQLGVIVDDADGSTPLVAVVQLAHAGALGVGYCLAPVVVARHPTTGKVTIAWWEAGLVDRGRLLAALSEEGWGGGATILGSPHAGTSLSLARIVTAVLDAVASASAAHAERMAAEAATDLAIRRGPVQPARLAVDLALALRPFAELAAIRAVVDESPDHIVWEARTGAGSARITRADLDRAMDALAQIGVLTPSLHLAVTAPPSARERLLADRIAVLESALAPFGLVGRGGGERRGRAGGVAPRGGAARSVPRRLRPRPPRPRGGVVTAAQEWAAARARTEVAAAAAADAAIDAEESAVDGEPDYVAYAVEAALGALADAVAAAEEALGETGGAVQRPRYVCPALAEACAERAAAIHRAVCAVDDGTGGVEAVRLAVAAARRAIS